MPYIEGWQVVQYIKELEEERPRRWWHEIDRNVIEICVWLWLAVAAVGWMLLR